MPRRLAAEVEQVAVNCWEEVVVLWVSSADEPCQYGAWYCELCFFYLSRNSDLERMQVYFFGPFSVSVCGKESAWWETKWRRSLGCRVAEQRLRAVAHPLEDPT